MSVTDGTSVPPHWSVNFAVPDADAITQRATTLGGTVLMSPFNTRSVT
jgi:predicted enzyme related to lactoylglutathione lyase